MHQNKGTERKQFLDTWMTNNSYSNDAFVVVGGDLNTTEDKRIDRNHSEPQPASSRPLVRMIPPLIWQIQGEGYTGDNGSTPGFTFGKILSIAMLEWFSILIKNTKSKSTFSMWAVLLNYTSFIMLSFSLGKNEKKRADYLCNHGEMKVNVRSGNYVNSTLTVSQETEPGQGANWR